MPSLPLEARTWDHKRKQGNGADAFISVPLLLPVCWNNFLLWDFLMKLRSYGPCFHLCLTNAASSHRCKASFVTRTLTMPPAKSFHSGIKIDICLYTIILLFPQFTFEKVQGKHGSQAALQLTPFRNSRFACAVVTGSTPPDSFSSLHSIPSLYCV